MRVFLDTNVLVSAFASRGICSDLLELILLEHDLIVGQNVLRKLRRAVRDKIRLSAARSSEIVDFIAGEAAEVVAQARPVDARVDPDDALVLGEARSGEAELFVTGDRMLLEAGNVEGIEIVSPRRFWDVLRGAKA